MTRLVRGAAVVLIAAFALATAVHAGGPLTTFDPARDGARDVEEAVALAKAQGKRVIVDVGGEWCGWCHILDQFIEANDDVRRAIDARYIWVKVNFSKQNDNAALLSRWPKVAGYPHLFVLDAGGALVWSQDTGVLEGGKSYDKARFIAFLARAAETQPAHSRGSSAASRRARAADGMVGFVGLPTTVL